MSIFTGSELKAFWLVVAGEKIVVHMIDEERIRLLSTGRFGGTEVTVDADGKADIVGDLHLLDVPNARGRQRGTPSVVEGVPQISGFDVVVAMTAFRSGS